jgi:hypothetical protein
LAADLKIHLNHEPVVAMNLTKLSVRNMAAVRAAHAEREHVSSARTFKFTHAAWRLTLRIGGLPGPGQQSGTTRGRLLQHFTRSIAIGTAAIFCWQPVAGRPADPHYGLEACSPIQPFLNHRLPPDQPEAGKWLVAPAFPQLRFANPVGLVPEQASNRLCVHQREGIIYAFENECIRNSRIELAFSPDGNTLALASRARGVQLFRAVPFEKVSAQPKTD